MMTSNTLSANHKSSATDSSTHAGFYRLSRDVILSKQDDVFYVFDLNRGNCFTLDFVGGSMLQETLIQGTVVAARSVAEQYRLAEVDALRDCEELARNMVQTGLLEIIPPPENARPKYLRLRIFLLLTVVWFLIRTIGFRKTTRMLTWFHRVNEHLVATTALQGEVELIDEAVRTAAAWHPLLTQCKERALVCWHLLRCHYRLPARIRLGILRYPFQAHVWVECGPWTVTDEREQCGAFIPCAEI